MPQFSRPSSDLSTGGWTTTPLWSKLDDNSTADFVDGPGTNAVALMGGTSVTDPVTATGYKMRFEARRFGGTVVSGDFCGIKYEILEGSTVRATRQVVTLNNSAFQEHEWNLTDAEANSIGNHANIRHRITEIIPSGSSDTPRVAWCELEVPTPALPAKVTGVQATDGTRAGDSKVTYNAASGATSYDIYSNTVNSFSGATKIKANNSGTSYVDTGAGVGSANKKWYFVVSKNAVGDGPVSSSDSGYAMDVPSVPTGLTASDSTSEDHVSITCDAPSGDGTITLKVLRDGVVIATGVTFASLPYLDTSAIPGTTYSYTGKWSNAAGDSAASTADNGTRAVGAGGGSTTAPTGFAATSGAFQSRVALSWDLYTDAEEMRVYRALVAIKPAAPFVTDISGAASAYDDTDVATGVDYLYWLTAVVDGVETDAAGPVTGSTATSALRFFQPFLKACVDVLFKGTAAVTGIHATPTVHLEALTDAYAFDPTDDDYPDIPAGAKVGLSAAYDPADDDEVDSSNSLFALADMTVQVAAGADPATQLLLYADHDSGTWQPLVCILDSFVGAPFDILGGDAVNIEMSRLLGGLFRISRHPTPGLAYPYALDQALRVLLRGSAYHALSSTAPTIKVNILSEAAILSPQHRFLSDIPDAWFCLGESAAETLAAVATANVGVTGARVTATNPVFASATSSEDGYSLLVYVHDADPDDALLLALLPFLDADGEPSPLVFDGTNVTIDINTPASGLWQLGE